MSKKKTTIILSMLLAFAASAYAQQQEKTPTPDEMAEKEAERLERLLKLEDWQVFYVDSTLRTNYAGMMEEITGLQKSRVNNLDLFYDVRDKWTEKTQNSYHKYFTTEQWNAYLKQEGNGIIKEREKRRARQQKQEAKKRK